MTCEHCRPADQQWICRHRRSILRMNKENYLTYAMSVIISRALPDIRDGLKAFATPYPCCHARLGS